MTRNLNKGIKPVRRIPYRKFTKQEHIDLRRKKYDRSPPLPSYTPKLDRLLADVVDAFSVLPEPPAESFEYKRTDARGNPREPLPSFVKSIAAIGDSKGASINASNVEDACSAMFYVKPDAFLWLVPKMLTAAQQWWSEVQRVAPEKEVEMRSGVFDYAYWKQDSLCRLRRIIGCVDYRFCNTSYSMKRPRDTRDRRADEERYTMERLHEYSITCGSLMTPKMRSALRAYLVEWYNVFGKGFSIKKGMRKLRRCKVYDCWL